MVFEMKVALWCIGGVAFLALAMTASGASELLVGDVTVPGLILCGVLLALGFRAERNKLDS